MSVLLILLCSLLCVTHAVSDSSSPPSIIKRALVSETSCDDAQDNPINQFLFQAVVLANSTLDKKLPDGTDFRHSTAYSNYFTEADWPIVSSMYRHVNDFTWKREQRNPQVWFLCSQPDAVPTACTSEQRIAFADPDPYPYTWDPAQWLPSSGIGFCSSFFGSKSPLLSQYLFSKSSQEWCKGETFGDFHNVGFFAMQLFVGMDVYGALAKIPSRPIPRKDGFYPRLTTHGATVSADLSGELPAVAARSLKKAWDDAASHGGAAAPLQRVQNGPSYAAAAVEWYFLTLCGRDREYAIPI
ncbi:hypothetical protein FKW77_001560 [Venturia effusa]|uniref:Uncharacterized protein n=1 Tax=Venturia effusa TaxID=50376 RepID=A0A517LDD8_9PEZI|nr:hypothetical protein FKW77_001560 [Venturia effusa]